jgi:hypothetical protein
MALAPYIGVSRMMESHILHITSLGCRNDCQILLIKCKFDSNNYPKGPKL